MFIQANLPANITECIKNTFLTAKFYDFMFGLWFVLYIKTGFRFVLSSFEQPEHQIECQLTDLNIHSTSAHRPVTVL